MAEGWRNDTYYILFDEQETERVSERYGIARYIPGFLVVGLSGWDDFIVRDADGSLFALPTVPLDRQYLRPVTTPILPDQLERDARYEGKIKWWIKPLVFGGDPHDAGNSTWVSREQHAELVRWWNDTYQSIVGSRP